MHGLRVVVVAVVVVVVLLVVVLLLLGRDGSSESVPPYAFAFIKRWWS